MDQINVGDRVQIIQVLPDDDPQLLHKFGSVMMIIDDVKFFLVLDEGGDAFLPGNQLKKVN